MKAPGGTQWNSAWTVLYLIVSCKRKLWQDTKNNNKSQRNCCSYFNFSCL